MPMLLQQQLQFQQLQLQAFPNSGSVVLKQQQALPVQPRCSLITGHGLSRSAGGAGSCATAMEETVPQELVCQRLGMMRPGRDMGFSREEMCEGVESLRQRCEEGALREAVEALDLLVQRRCGVDTSLLYRVLKKCMADQDLVLGRHVHALAVENGYESDAFLANHVIGMYASHSRLDEARQVFRKVAVPNAYMWSSIIMAHARHGQPSEAINLYRQMREAAFEPDNHIYVAVLKACAAAEDLVAGQEVHGHVLGGGIQADVFVGNSLVIMYAKCGSLDAARRVFDGLSTRTVVTWNAMLGGYVQHGCCEEALSLYSGMPRVEANHVTFMHLLQACVSLKALHQGKHLHAEIRQNGLTADVLVGNCLVDMYAKCGSLEDARSVFDSLPLKDIVTWNAMIVGYAQQGLGGDALALYARMQQDGMPAADHVTFSCLLKACASMRTLHGGKQLHAHICERAQEATMSVGSSLVDMYCKCESLEDARRVFDRLPTTDVVTWNAMMAGYNQQGLTQEVFALFDKMREDVTMLPDCVTFVCLLQACASIGALHEGTQLHAHIQQRGLEGDAVVANSLVNMYAKCGSLEGARIVFDRMRTRDVIAWNTMIAGYAQEGLCQEALALYTRIQQEGTTPANHVTFVSVLNACSSLQYLHQGKQIHAQIRKRGLETDVSVGTSLVVMYAKCGSLDDAREAFDRLPSKTAVTWNAMITGYAQHGHGGEALELYATMHVDGITPADEVTFICLLQACASAGALEHGKRLHAQIREQGLEAELEIGNCLVGMYSKCGSLEDARRVFDELPARDVVTWTSMLTGYGQHGLGQRALALYAEMQKERVVAANHLTFVCLLKACASVGALRQGMELHSQIHTAGLEDDALVGNSLVDMYSKCGSLGEARRVFDRLPERDVVTWTTMINAYAEHGEGEMAVQCFEEMREEGVTPDGTTFNCLLVACSHAGLVHQGQRYMRIMVDEYGIEPTDHHYSCMVDLLGRSGCLDEAEGLLQTAPLKSYGVAWTSLLSACKNHGDAERGERCFDHLVSLQPHNATAYVLLGNIYASAGRWKDVDRTERLRKAGHAMKKPAKACIEVRNESHEFRVGEERLDISLKLTDMNTRVKADGGHVPQTELVLKSVPEQEKEDALCGHAEKLALAYGLLNTPDGTTLVVTKNLRMCNDCHSSTKIMSRLEKREIVVRDSHRVHRFRYGACSCGDRH